MKVEETKRRIFLLFKFFETFFTIWDSFGLTLYPSSINEEEDELRVDAEVMSLER